MISEQEKQFYLLIALSFYAGGWLVLYCVGVKLTQKIFTALAVISLLIYSLPFVFKTSLPWKQKLAIEIVAVAIVIVYAFFVKRLGLRLREIVLQHGKKQPAVKAAKPKKMR